MRRALASISVSTGILAGCVPIPFPLPPLGRQVDESSLAAALVPGKSTRTSVRAALREPVSSIADGAFEVFEGGSEAMNLAVVLFPLPIGGISRIAPVDVRVVVGFDPADRVTGYAYEVRRGAGTDPDQLGGASDGSLATLIAPAPRPRLRRIAGWTPPEPGRIGLILSPDGQRFAIVHRGGLLVRDARTGGLVATLDVTARDCLHERPPLFPPAALLGSGRYVVVRPGRRMLCLHDLDEGASRPMTLAVDVDQLAPLPQGGGRDTQVLAQRFDGAFQLLELAEDARVLAAGDGLGPGLGCLPPAVLTTPRHLLQPCYSFRREGNDGRLYVRDLDIPMEVQVLALGAPAAGGLKVAGDGWVAVGLGTHVVLLGASAYSGNGRGPGLPRVERVLPMPLGPAGLEEAWESASVGLSADGRRLAAGFGGCAVWDTAAWRQIWRCDHEDMTLQQELARGFVMTADGRRLATAGGLYALPEDPGSPGR